MGLCYQRIDLLGAIEFLNRFIGAPERQQIMSVAGVCSRQARIEFERAAKFALGTRPVPVKVQLHVTHRSVSFRKGIVEFNGLGSSCFGLWHYFERSAKHRALIIVSISEAGVR